MSYLLTREAEDDLQAIAEYSFSTWDEETADRYLGDLLEAFDRISNGGLAARRFSDTYPNLRVCLVRQQFVFFLANDEQPIQIIGVIHERRDVVAVLAGRA